jgi:uncharacterized protein YkwD/succinate dehydrogenase/fumarate reductase cytochrome b subunit
MDKISKILQTYHDEQSIFYKVNWEIVTTSHDICNRRGRIGHRIRQHIRRHLWRVAKHRYPVLKKYVIIGEIHGDSRFRIIQPIKGIRIRLTLTLKQFTVVSILLMLLGLLPHYFTLYNYLSTFQFAFEIGVVCFFLAYFLYAVKCWGAKSKICAVLMIAIPLLAYSLATSNIQNSITNIFLSLFIQFCIYAIISAILLHICNIVRKGIERYAFKRSRESHRYFSPKLSYSVIGLIVVSLLVVNLGGVTMFSNNAATISKSLQIINFPSYTMPSTGTNPSSADSQNSIVIPTIQPEVVSTIETAVGNSQPVIDIPTLESQIHSLINQQRTENGLSDLSYDTALADIARKHSADMAQTNYFSHYTPQGLSPTDRGNQAGYSCYKNYGSYYTSGIAENIMQNNLYTSVTYYDGVPSYAWNSQDALAQSTVIGWMNSPGHRQNILTSTYEREGIGVAIASDDKVYITEDFC